MQLFLTTDVESERPDTTGSNKYRKELVAPIHNHLYESLSREALLIADSQGKQEIPALSAVNGRAKMTSAFRHYYGNRLHAQVDKDFNHLSLWLNLPEKQDLANSEVFAQEGKADQASVNQYRRLQPLLAEKCR